jgi:hypothetical protein
MSIEVRQMTIKATVVRSGPVPPGSGAPIDADAIKEELREELRQVLAEMLRDQRER